MGILYFSRNFLSSYCVQQLHDTNHIATRESNHQQAFPEIRRRQQLRWIAVVYYTFTSFSVANWHRSPFQAQIVYWSKDNNYEQLVVDAFLAFSIWNLMHCCFSLLHFVPFVEVNIIGEPQTRDNHFLVFWRKKREIVEHFQSYIVDCGAVEMGAYKSKGPTIFIVAID